MKTKSVIVVRPATMGAAHVDVTDLPKFRRCQCKVQMSGSLQSRNVGLDVVDGDAQETWSRVLADDGSYQAEPGDRGPATALLENVVALAGELPRLSNLWVLASYQPAQEENEAPCAGQGEHGPHLGASKEKEHRSGHQEKAEKLQRPAEVVAGPARPIHCAAWHVQIRPKFFSI